MDEERKEPELEEDEDFEEEPDFEEFDPDAAPVDEKYHQISLPEEQPELFGDSAAEEARLAQEEILEDEAPGAYAAAQQQAEEDREVEEILERRSAVNPVPKDDSWKTIHSEFAAEVERFAHEAEDFAKKVNDYINDPDMNFGLDGDEKKKEKPASKAGKKAEDVNYMDVEPEPVDIPSKEETIIPEPEPKPTEPRRRTKRRKPARDPAAVEAVETAEEVSEAASDEDQIRAERARAAEERREAAEARKAEKRRKKEERRKAREAAQAAERRRVLDAEEAVEPVEDIEVEPTGKPVEVRRKWVIDPKKWRRKPEAPKIDEVVVPAEFDIPLGTEEEWVSGEAEEPVVADRERPKFSFNDDPTRELSPVEELHLGDNSLRQNEASAEQAGAAQNARSAEAAADVDIPDVQVVDLSNKKEEKPDGITGDTEFLPDLGKLRRGAAAGAAAAGAAAGVAATAVNAAAEAADESTGDEIAEATEAAKIAAERVATPEVSETVSDLDRTLEKFLVSDKNAKRARQDYVETELVEEEDPDSEDEVERTDADAVAEPREERPRRGVWDSIKHSVVNALEGGESEGEFEDEDSEEEPEREPALADKTVALPTRNERITHQFHDKIEPKEEETAPVSEEPQDDQIDEAYNSFRTAVLKDVDAALNPRESPEEEAEEETEPDKQETLDLAEAAAKKQAEERRRNRTSKFDHTFELEKAPSIVPADAHFNSLDRTILAREKDMPVVHEDPEQIDGQIKFEGFDEEEPTPEQVDDKHVEAALRAKRTQQVREFKIEKPGSEPAAEDVEPSSLDDMPTFGHGTDVKDFLHDEYHGPDDRRRINQELNAGARNALISTIAQAVLTVAGLVLAIFVALAHGNLEAIGGSTVTCGIIGVLLLLASAGFGWQIMRKGFTGIFKGRINAASGFAVLYTVSLVEDIVLMFVETSSQAASLYTAAACFGMTMSCWSRYLSLKRVMDNFKFMNSGTKLQTTRVITSKDDAKQIGRGLLGDEPVIAYHTTTEIPAGFIEDSLADDPADEYSSRPFFIVIAVAAIVGLIAGILNHSAATGVNVLTCILALGIPAFSILAYNYGLYYVDKYFSRKNAVILGHRAVEKSAYIDSFAVDSSELFGKGSCSILGIKTFHDMKIDDAILYAAALVIRSGGPLADVFEKTILGKRNLLPKIEDLQYEERLGLSAWTHDRRILFGNREFLVNHNVQVPNTEYEAEYTRNGQKVCYLAISGKIAAMFVLRYRASRKVRKCLRQMDRAGIVLLVSNTDCNVTEEMISKKFRISPEAVKVISPVSSDILKKYQNGDEGTESEDIGILHTGSPEASMKSLYEARRLYDGVSINNVFVLTYAAIAVILGIIFTFVSNAGMISDPFVLLAQVVGTLIAVGIAWSRSRQNVKEKKKK